MNIGVIGYSGSINSATIKSIENNCTATGRLVARLHHTLFTGGRNGVMELTSKGAKEAGGTVVGVLPVNEPEGNVYNDVRVQTGMDYMMRSLVLVHTVDLGITIGGEIGTLFEMVSAYAYGKPIVLFRGTGGWTDRIADMLIDGEYLDNRRIVKITQIYTIQELENLLKEERYYGKM